MREAGLRFQKASAWEQFYSLQSRKFVEDSFAGSLPAFVAAFTKEKALTPEEAAEIRRIIDEA